MKTRKPTTFKAVFTITPAIAANLMRIEPDEATRRVAQAAR
jgi:hypothetical protein